MGGYTVKEPKLKYSKVVVEEAIKKSLSFADVIRCLGLKVSGGNFRSVKFYIRYYQLETPHFLGVGHAKGKSKENCQYIRDSISTRIRRGVMYANDEIFTENSPVIKGSTLTKRLISLDWPYKCKKCGVTEWLGELLKLHLDHVNGIHNDNRLDNLQFLCPNCHQQTPTWGNKNRRKSAQVLELADKSGLEPDAPLLEYACASHVLGIKVRKPRIPRKLKFEVSKENLQKLVWEKSTSAIAKSFGVTDNAVAKRCKKFEVEKPPRGYWAKIAAGICPENAAKQCREFTKNKQVATETKLTVENT